MGKAWIDELGSIMEIVMHIGKEKINLQSVGLSDSCSWLLYLNCNSQIFGWDVSASQQCISFQT